MRIKDNILLEIVYEDKQYLVRIQARQDIVFVENNAWEADVDFLQSSNEFPIKPSYPYFTIWGNMDKQGFPTTDGIHALINYENYDERVDNSSIRVVENE